MSFCQSKHAGHWSVKGEINKNKARCSTELHAMYVCVCAATLVVQTKNKSNMFMWQDLKEITQIWNYMENLFSGGERQWMFLEGFITAPCMWSCYPVTTSLNLYTVLHVATGRCYTDVVRLFRQNVLFLHRHHMWLEWCVWWSGYRTQLVMTMGEEAMWECTVSCRSVMARRRLGYSL